METVNKSLEEMNVLLTKKAMEFGKYSGVEYYEVFNVFVLTLRPTRENTGLYVGLLKENRWILLRTRNALAEYLSFRISRDILSDKNIAGYDESDRKLLKKFQTNSDLDNVLKLLECYISGCDCFERFLDLAFLDGPAEEGLYVIDELIEILREVDERVRFVGYNDENVTIF